MFRELDQKEIDALTWIPHKKIDLFLAANAIFVIAIGLLIVL